MIEVYWVPALRDVPLEQIWSNLRRSRVVPWWAPYVPAWRQYRLTPRNPAP